MKPILAATRLYLVGSFRQQVHLATLFLAVLLFMLPAYINAFSLGLHAFQKVTTDFGLTLIGYFLLGLGILLGSTSLPEEIETRRLYPVLVRSISRTGFLLAHLLAVLAVLALSGLVLGLCLAASLGLMTRSFDSWIFQAILGSFLQAAVVSALCLACSVRLSPALSAVVGLAIFVVGSLSNDLMVLLFGISESFAVFAKAAFPDLSAFALKDSAVEHLPVTPGRLALLVTYAAGWVALSLAAARTHFEEVDL